MSLTELLAEVDLMIEETNSDRQNFTGTFGIGDPEALNYYDHRLESLREISEELFRLQDLES